MRISRIKLSFVALGLLFIGSQATMSIAQEDHNINMILGDVQNVKVDGLTRVSVTDPDIADIADANDNEVSVVARRMGHTILFVWDKGGKKVYSVNVANDDLARIKARIETLLKDAGITTIVYDANYVEGKVVLSGNVNKDQKSRLDKVLEPFSEQVINLCKEDEAQELIQIDMQITELSSTLDKKLGFDWTNSGGGTTLTYAESGNPTTGGSPNWFKLGQFNRTTSIINTINLLVSQGKARTLSRPRMLVTSGKEATINVGGEVPIQSTTTSASSTSTQTNVTFKQYGLTVTVTPTIKEGKIDVLMNLQVSDIDTTFPVAATSTNGVAYKTRNATTQLMLDDKQTVVMAGLIRYTDSDQKKSVPFIGKIPVVGMMFRSSSKQAPDEAKELVITLTPVIVHNKKYAKDQFVIPTKELNDFVDEAEKINNYKREPVDPNPNMGNVTTMPAQDEPAVVPAKVKRVEMPAQKPKAILEEQIKKEVAVQEPIATVQKYMQDIQVKISQNISYPLEALKNKWQGTVKLRLNIQKDGTLIAANVVQSSGHQAFDDDALNAAKIAAPYAPFSKDMQASDLNVTIPIVYQAK